MNTTYFKTPNSPSLTHCFFLVLKHVNLKLGQNIKLGVAISKVTLVMAFVRYKILLLNPFKIYKLREAMKM